MDSQMILFKFSPRWDGEFISYISWCRVLWRLSCVYADGRSMSHLKNTERLRPSSCVWGGNYLWCSVVDDLGDVEQWSLFHVSPTGDLTRLNWVLLTMGSKQRVVVYGDFVFLCMGWRQSMMQHCNWYTYVGVWGGWPWQLSLTIFPLAHTRKRLCHKTRQDNNSCQWCHIINQ